MHSHDLSSLSASSIEGRCGIVSSSGLMFRVCMHASSPSGHLLCWQCFHPTCAALCSTRSLSVENVWWWPSSLLSICSSLLSICSSGFCSFFSSSSFFGASSTEKSGGSRWGRMWFMYPFFPALHCSVCFWKNFCAFRCVRCCIRVTHSMRSSCIIGMLRRTQCAMSDVLAVWCGGGWGSCVS